MLITLKTATKKNTGNSMTLLNPCYKKENLKTPNRPRNNIMQTNDLEKKKKGNENSLCLHPDSH